MRYRRGLSAALALLLTISAQSALAAEVSVCSGISCPASGIPGIGELGSNEALGPEGVAVWVKEHRVTGLDPHHWAAPLLVGLVGSGLLVVRDGDHLDPDAPVTLWKAAHALMGSSKQPTEGMSPREIAVRAAELGLFPGPVPAEDRPVTRLEAAYMVAQLTQFPGEVEQKIDLNQALADWEAIPPESRDLVYWVTIQNRLFVGYPDKSFRPAEPLTVGQFAAVQQRLRAWWPDPAPGLTGG